MNERQNFLFLNLPANDKITRRYMCSYQSPTSLFPPLELLSLASVYTKLTNRTPSFIDAIANLSTVDDVCAFIQSNPISHVVSLIGFECFQEDMEVINSIKRRFPDLCFIVFGHYPTLFAQEILDKSTVNIVLKGEPEEVFAARFDSLENRSLQKEVWAEGSSINTNQNRIRDYNSIPIPNFSLVNHNAYHEPMMARPFGMIQSARGCPYSCNYCVKSFGTKLTLRSPDRVIEEIILLQELHGLKALRFVDDTFTINKQRVKNICDLIIENNIKIEWSCLSRTDNVDEEILHIMKRAGCKRIYYGVENASQRILDFYKKGIDVNEALNAIKLTNKSKIETAGFFMLGLPEETEDDFKLNKDFIKEAKFDYIGIGGLVLYPGTELFELYKNEIEFSLFPYVNRFKDKTLQSRYLKWNKELYKAFIYSNHFVKSTLVKTLQSPLQTIDTITNALSYQYTFNRGVFHHIQKHKSELNYHE